MLSLNERRTTTFRPCSMPVAANNIHQGSGCCELPCPLLFCGRCDEDLPWRRPYGGRCMVGSFSHLLNVAPLYTRFVGVASRDGAGPHPVGRERHCLA